jgi:16S rRNA C1402 (ribose-2'-O) methylase RsmI
MTKVYEEVFFGSAVEAKQHFSLKPVKGEIVLIIEKLPATTVLLSSLNEDELRAQLDKLMRTESLSKSAAIKQMSQQLKTSRRELYQMLVSRERTQNS